MAYNDEIVALIDARVGKLIGRDKAVGTVVSVQGDALRARVVMDGSAQDMPVKVLGHAEPQAGDRVVLVLVDGAWCVIDAYAQRWPESQGLNQQLGADTTTSATFATLASTPSFTFTKRWDATRVCVRGDMQAFSTVNSTIVVIGVRFTDADAVVTEFHIVRQYWSTAFIHTGFGGTKYCSGLVAGVYTVVPLWARWSGTGTITTNTDDWISYSAAEVGP